MARKKKRLIDQIYNGAFANAELTQSSKNALLTAGGILAAGVVASLIINQNGLDRNKKRIN
jgi:hypothetical protein